MNGAHLSDSTSFPGLLRAARTVYATAIRAALAAAGYADVPKNGVFVLGAIARGHAPLSDIIQRLGVSKQAAGQLVDALVVRGYLDRKVDAEDRRRLTVGLTERGRDAARVARAAIERVDARLAARVGAQSIGHARQVLLALEEVAREP